MCRCRYLRRHRPERYLKGTHSTEDTANFPKLSTVGPHEFCRRSYSRRKVLRVLMDIKSVNLEIKSKNLLTMYLIHRNLTHRTQFIANRNTKNSMKTQLRQRFSIFYHVVFRPHDFIAQLERPIAPTAPFALLSRHLNQWVAAVLHDHDFDCKLYSPSLVVDHLINRRLTSLRIYMTIS